MPAGPAARSSITLVGRLACVGALALLFSASAAPLEIMSRTTWKAKVPDAKLMKQQEPRSIVIHHTSVRQQPNVSLERKMQGLQSFSRVPGKVGNNPKPAWGDVPYHFYVDARGRVAEGRDINFAGDSNTKYDLKDRIQVVLEGDFEREEPSAQQLAALQELLTMLSAKYKIPAKKITGHNDHAATDCPGTNLKRHFQNLRKAVAAAAPK